MSAKFSRRASVGDLVAALRSRGGPDVEPDDDAAPEDEAPASDESSDDAPADPEAPAAEGDDLDMFRAVPGENQVAGDYELADSLPMAPEDDLSKVEGEASPRLMSLVESLLFAGDRPMTVKQIRRILREPTVRQIQLALKGLAKATRGRGVILGQVAGGFRLQTHPSNAKWVQKMLAGRPARLSRSQLEALAVVAYRQPITKAEVDHVRGVDCGAVLRILLERDLVKIVGRKEEPGRPHLYGTTVDFLEFFNLRSLRDMPDLHEFRELSEDSRAELRERYGEDAEEVEAEVLGQGRLDFTEGEGAQSETESESEAESESESESETETESETEPETESESEPEPEPETETESESESESESEPESESESESEPEPEPESEAEPEAEPESTDADAERGG